MTTSFWQGGVPHDDFIFCGERMGNRRVIGWNMNILLFVVLANDGRVVLPWLYSVASDRCRVESMLVHGEMYVSYMACLSDFYEN